MRGEARVGDAGSVLVIGLCDLATSTFIPTFSRNCNEDSILQVSVVDRTRRLARDGYIA